MKLTHRALVSIAVLVIAGCSTAPQRCPLDENGRASCRSMQESYTAAVNTPLPSASREKLPLYANFDDTAPAAQEQGFQGYPQPRQLGMPVYEPARVYRVWTAPWTDADGVLHGGEYVYFTTPGRWAYGSLKQSGDASDIFRPLAPDALGIDPITGAKAKALEAAQKAAAQQPKPADKQQNTPAVQTAPQGITQPYQRLDLN